MDVRQLSALVAIADHGTFSAAARALFTVQSNVSGHIAKMERELGVTLVDRAHGGLTDEGTRVVERARRILHEIEDIVADMASVDAEPSGDARIGVIGTTARWLMPQLMTEITRSLPLVRPIVHEGSTSTLIPAVLSGELNSAIIHLPVDDPELLIQPIFAEDLVLLAHTNHPLSTRTTMSIKELDDVPLLLPPKGTALRRVLDRSAASADISLRAQAEIDGVRLLASLAFEDYGPAIVPATAVPRWVKGDFVRIQVPELPRRVVAIAHRRRPSPSAATTAVLRLLQHVIAERGPLQPGVHLNVEAIHSGSHHHSPGH
jgi:LysR family hydrogen peroxide-inducible transcriptional activator